MEEKDFEPIKLDVPSKIEQPVKGPAGIQALWEMELNSVTKKLFDKGRTPRVGRRYAWKCSAVKGNRAYFTLVQL